MPAPAASQIEARLGFMKIDAETSELLRQLKPIIDRELPQALDKFYEQLRATPEVKKFFSSSEHISRAKTSQVQHWGSISTGNFNDIYMRNVQKIGQTHARIGLEPRWYIGGYAIIAEHLIGAVIEENCSDGGLWGRRKGLASRDLGKAIGALAKAVMLDMDLSISVYITAAEEARLRGEEEAKAKEQAAVAGSFGVGLSHLAAKDLAYRMSENVPEAYRRLRDDFNMALEQMETAIGAVQSSITIVNSSSNEIASAADDLSKRGRVLQRRRGVFLSGLDVRNHALRHGAARRCDCVWDMHERCAVCRPLRARGVLFRLLRWPRRVRGGLSRLIARGAMPSLAGPACRGKNIPPHAETRGREVVAT